MSFRVGHKPKHSKPRDSLIVRAKRVIEEHPVASGVLVAMSAVDTVCVVVERVLQLVWFVTHLLGIA